LAARVAGFLGEPADLTASAAVAGWGAGRAARWAAPDVDRRWSLRPFFYPWSTTWLFAWVTVPRSDANGFAHDRLVATKRQRVA